MQTQGEMLVIFHSLSIVQTSPFPFLHAKYVVELHSTNLSVKMMNIKHTNIRDFEK